MKRFLKITFLVLLSLLFLFIGFFLWASSPNLSSGEYAEVYVMQKEHSAKVKDTYSVLTYNIGYLSGMTNNRAVEKPKELFDNNLNRVIEQIEILKPDLIAFQEIDYDAKRSYHVNQEQRLAEEGYNFIARSVNWDKKYLPFPYYPPSLHFGEIISGQSILSKYPIEEQVRIVLQRNEKNPFYYDSFYLDRLAQVVKLDLGTHQLVLINVHLEAFDQETRKEQMQVVKKLYLRYSANYPTILLGDFNSDIRYPDPAIRSLLEIPEIGNSAVSSDGMPNTFPSRNPTERLDYIFYSTTFIEEISSQVPQAFGEASDHLPVLLEFKFKNNNYGEIN